MPGLLRYGHASHHGGTTAHSAQGPEVATPHQPDSSVPTSARRDLAAVLISVSIMVTDVGHLPMCLSVQGLESPKLPQTEEQSRRTYVSPYENLLQI